VGTGFGRDGTSGISAVIITLNEERNIGRCIASVQGVADEVIVVDAESTDCTAAIAAEHGARVVARRWTDYSDQKNFANGLAHHAFILSLDADEELSPQLRASLLAARQAGLHGAYSVHRLTNYCGDWVRHGGWYPDTKVRLFPKSAVRWEGEYVHETLGLDPGTSVTLLKGDLLHYSYPSLRAHEERIERYSDLHARKLLAAGKRAGFAKLWLSPAAKFLQCYLLRLGFLDGGAGYRIATLSAKAVYLKYQKLNLLRRDQDA
jgi:glycosyltransferase involved in cell wall biosynthesis